VEKVMTSLLIEQFSQGRSEEVLSTVKLGQVASGYHPPGIGCPTQRWLRVSTLVACFALPWQRRDSVDQVCLNLVLLSSDHSVTVVGHDPSLQFLCNSAGASPCSPGRRWR